jgi:hypothetical protein
MDRYSARINLHGTTKRERELNLLKNSLTSDVSNLLSCKTVLLNGETYQLVINTGTQPYYKEFETLPGQSINIGDYVDFANKKWLVTTADADDEVYIDGKLEECNWLLKWQNETGEIIERWAVVMSASKYNDGTSGNNVIVLGSDQLSIKIPVDEESLKLKKSMSKKFFIDNDSTNPTTYELTGTGNVPDTYGGHGVTSWIVKECAYSPTADDLKYGVCNYIAPTTPSQPENGNETVASIASTISGNTSLKVGFPRTYSVIFMDKNGAELSDVEFSWNIVSDFNDEIDSTVDGKNITLQIDNEDYVDEQIVLQIMIDGTVNSELVIKIKGIF